MNRSGSRVKAPIGSKKISKVSCFPSPVYWSIPFSWSLLVWVKRYFSASMNESWFWFDFRSDVRPQFLTCGRDVGEFSAWWWRAEVGCIVATSIADMISIVVDGLERKLGVFELNWSWLWLFEKKLSRDHVTKTCKLEIELWLEPWMDGCSAEYSLPFFFRTWCSDNPKLSGRIMEARDSLKFSWLSYWMVNVGKIVWTMPWPTRTVSS